MDKLKEVGGKTSEKIEELQIQSLKSGGSLMFIIRKNIKNWDMKLKPICSVSGKSYVEAVSEILKSCGHDVEKKKLTTYLYRARKGIGG